MTRRRGHLPIGLLFTLLGLSGALVRFVSLFVVPTSLRNPSAQRPLWQAAEAEESRGERLVAAAAGAGTIPADSDAESAPPETFPGLKSVLGGDLQRCSVEPLTGWYRDGYCRTDDNDQGRHLVCVSTTEDFLQYQRAIGNDLSTPMPMYGFPGLKPGDNWCVCASRWAEAVVAGVSAPVRAHATHVMAGNFAPEETLRRLAIDL